MGRAIPDDRTGTNYHNLLSLLCRTFAVWNDHEALRLGAALAFYSILSLAPLMILVVGIVAVVFGRSTAHDQIIGQVEGMVGKEGGSAIRAMIEHAQKPATGVFASIVGIITMLFGASGVFGELQGALNKMWDVVPEKGGGIWTTIRQKFFSFGIVLAVGFLLLTSLLLSAGLAALGKYFEGILPLPEFVLSGLNFLFSFAGIAILFALIFKYIPATKIAWKDVCVGAIVTAFFFTLEKYLIGLYLGKTAVGSAYGAGGSLVIVIVWIYYSSLIVLFEAEFTHELNENDAAPKPAPGKIRDLE